MKNLFLAAMLCILGFAAQSQTVTNNSNCPVNIRALCYDPNTCSVLSVCAVIVVPPGVTLALPNCACPTPGQQGYRVCWNSPTACTGTCTQVGSAAGPWPCSIWPNVGFLPNCANCGNSAGGVRVFYNAAGNMIIQ